MNNVDPAKPKTSTNRSAAKGSVLDCCKWWYNVVAARVPKKNQQFAELWCNLV